MPICSACYPDRPCTCIRPTTGGVGGGPGSSSRLIQALRTAAEIAGRRARGGDESGIAVYDWCIAEACRMEAERAQRDADIRLGRRVTEQVAARSGPDDSDDHYAALGALLRDIAGGWYMPEPGTDEFTRCPDCVGVDEGDLDEDVQRRRS